MTAIRFYSHRRGPWAFLSNFYRSPFELDGCTWSTVEHYFQAMKCPAHAATVRVASSPSEAKRLGRRAVLRDDWDHVRDGVMLTALRAKFVQHLDLREALLSSGERPLVEAAPRDFYWGDGTDGSGRNRLGELLMGLRAELRTATAPFPGEVS